MNKNKKIFFFIIKIIIVSFALIHPFFNTSKPVENYSTLLLDKVEVTSIIEMGIVYLLFSFEYLKAIPKQNKKSGWKTYLLLSMFAILILLVPYRENSYFIQMNQFTLSYADMHLLIAYSALIYLQYVLFSIFQYNQRRWNLYQMLCALCFALTLSLHSINWIVEIVYGLGIISLLAFPNI